jgi:hypothetical protein
MVKRKIRQNKRSRRYSKKTNKKSKRRNNKKTNKKRRSNRRKNRRNQKAGAYRLDPMNQIAGKAVVEPYYRCYNPVMNGGSNCANCNKNINLNELLYGGSNGQLSNFSADLTKRAFGCTQPEWGPSCI